ncbi:putative vacuolar protein sorting-associated protein Ist1 [Lupinus albus]|uniref:Putative vacuolar protein sorting-associated protein Ist1 n=1 Tax=Lupinus albus TaxID=3870 RepID=A0A6A4Q0R8_LUPAL|nr:putative vacuolar protein sorting-associated protein Ist1 [Lupinus albus]
MLDGLLGRSFAAKCKSLMKLTKSRIEVIRRKRRATEKFLKKDIADLLHNGLDINAYGRAEGLMVELMLSSCYDFVEQLCEFVLKRLSVMQKLSGCPEECREAVASLMFAAARFSDLPELRDLRQIFQERYENSLECYVNQKFAANLNLKSSTLEKKVCLMQEIASEFSIKWDSKDFELRMSKSSLSAQGHNSCMPNHLTNHDKPSHGKDATPKVVKCDVLFDKSPDHPNDGFQNGKEAVVLNRDKHDLRSRSILPENGVKPLVGCEVTWKSDNHDNSLTRRQEISAKTSEYWKEGSMLKPPIGCSSEVKTAEQFEGGHDNPLIESQHVASKSHRGYRKEGSMQKPIGRSLTEKIVEQFDGSSRLYDTSGNTSRLRESPDTASRKSPSHAGMCFKSDVNKPFSVDHVSFPDTHSSVRKVQMDKTPMLKPCYSNAIPPPYVKPKSKQLNSTNATNVSSHIDSGAISTYYSAYDKPDSASTSKRIEIGLDSTDQDWQASGHERPSKQSHEKELSIGEDAKEVPVLKPKSLRRKHSKSRSRHKDATNEETQVVRKSRSRSRRRDESRRGLQILFNDEQHQNAEEEKIIDKLLIHYSKKPSMLVPEKSRRKSRSRHAQQMDNSGRESPQNVNGDGSDETPEMVTFSPRSVSLPREQTAAMEVKKVYTRAASFHPDGSNEARHVHPKLPDYEDLAARFAALRGR